MPQCPCRVITDVDLHVGAIVPILQRTFELLDADEFTLQYMENNRQVYVMADAEKALQAIATAVKAGAETSKISSSGCVSYYARIQRVRTSDPIRHASPNACT